MQLVQRMAIKLSLNATSLPSMMLNPTHEDFVKYKSLENEQIMNIRARLSLLKYLNQLVTPLLHYVDVSSSALIDDISNEGTAIKKILPFLFYIYFCTRTKCCLHIELFKFCK